ncbi:mip family channel protein [Stylonychia lemnae]|uniref:Mip family channel protein n=1 Tax=Stylonychia lemnae TaxID=5949 RepID=A0A078B468_STYLE|nr:mip family channel protein [Stylonychia lemnae]|eukprot:CDW89325.1 mip family channel protein [Stylonychia lemnae]
METGIFQSAKKTIPLVLLYELLGSALITCAYQLSASRTEIDNGVRAAAFMVGWIIASTISGAHFNPALSLAVLIYERKKSYIKYYFMIITAQLVGSFLGILIEFLLARFYRVELYPEQMTINDGQLLYFKIEDNGDLTPYYARLLFSQFLASFTFFFVTLIIKYKKALSTVEDPIKGLGISLCLYCCYVLTRGSGAALNPWFGLTQSILYFGAISNQNREISDYDKIFWIYILAPFVAGACAGLFTIFHHRIESLGIEVPLSNSIINDTFRQTIIRKSQYNKQGRQTYRESTNNSKNFGVQEKSFESAEQLLLVTQE